MFRLRKALANSIKEQIRDKNINNYLISSGLRSALRPDDRMAALAAQITNIRQTGEALARMEPGETIPINLDTVIHHLTKNRDGSFTIVKYKPYF